MKICIFMQNIYTLGGIQKIVSTLIDIISKDNNYDISLLMPLIDNKTIDWKINDSVKIYDYNKLIYHNHNTIVSKIKNKICNNTRIINMFPNMEKAAKFLFNQKALNNLTKFINDNQFDVVIACGSLFSIELGHISDKVQSKTIGWQHSTYEAYFKERGSESYGKSRIGRKTYKKLDQVWVLNKKDKEKFDKEFNINSIIMNNSIEISNEKSNLKNKNVLFLGRMNKNIKGIDYLLKIIIKVSNIDNQIQFFILGDGKDKYWIERKIKFYNLNNVKVLGNILDTKKYYLNSSLTINTSRVEGFGMTIIESMSYGIPVIAFHNKGPDEIITNNKDGYLINKYDINDFSKKVCELLNNKEKIVMMSKNCNEKIEKYDINEFIVKFKNLIQNI